MKSLWELLWNYDPNGLIVVDRDLIVRVVNPALCSLFAIHEEELVGAPVSTVWEDTQEFTEVWETGNTLSGIEKEYPALDLYVRKLYFPVKEEGLVACIVIDMTKEWKQREEMQVLKRETIQKMHTIVDKQMSVAQKIAGLLGETTAETKVSLLKLMELVEKERL